MPRVYIILNLALHLVFAVMLCLPKAMYDTLLVGGQPIYQYAFALLLICESGTLWLGSNSRSMSVWAPFVVALLATTFATVLNWGENLASTFTIMFDLSCVSAAVGGLLLGLNLKEAAAKLLFVMVQSSCVVSLFVTAYLLKEGFIEQAQEGTRVYDEAMFFSATIAAVLLPVAVYYICEKGWLWLAWGLLAISMAGGIWFSEMSATRSILLLNVVAATAGLWVLGRTYKQRLIIFSGAGVLGVLAWMYILGEGSYASNLSVRLTEEGFSSASRGDEISLMFEQLGVRLFTGIGIGGAYFGGIAYKDNPLGVSFAPHIGILTPLLKGGVIALFTLVVWPVFSGVRALCSSRTSPYRNAVLLSITVYVVLSSVSGGYYYGNIVFVALLIGQCQPRSEIGKRKVVTGYVKNARLRNPRLVAK